MVTLRTIFAVVAGVAALGLACGGVPSWTARSEPAANHATSPSALQPPPVTIAPEDAAVQPAPGGAEVGAALRRSLRVAVISDLNSGYGSKSYAPSVHAAAKAMVDRIHPDLVLITGDMVAGQKSGLDYRGMWEAFHTSVTDPLLAAEIPVAPAPGNHDAAPGFAVERRQYIAQWTDPARTARVRYLDDSSYPLYYSFEHESVFFAAVDATAVGPLRGRQRAWLDEQLSQTGAEVKIVFGHLPNHPFAKRREKEILDDSEFEEILGRHRVDAYVSGHHHAYYPGAVDGVRHVATPCLGGGPRRLLGRSRRSSPALLLVEIDDASGITSLDAFVAPDFDNPVERRTLPARIRYGHHAIVRDDLADLQGMANATLASP